MSGRRRIRALPNGADRREQRAMYSVRAKHRAATGNESGDAADLSAFHNNNCAGYTPTHTGAGASAQSPAGNTNTGRTPTALESARHRTNVDESIRVAAHGENAP